VNPPRPTHDVAQISLAAGEVFMSDQPTAVTTLLGSCISVCIFDPVTKRGAMCHASLPNAPLVLHKDPLRYVDEAVLYLVERYRRMGAPTERLVVKLFGGADVLGKRYDGYESIGRQNTMAAIETLGWQGLRIAVRETGGDRGRKIVFMNHTGEVFVKRLNPVSSHQLAAKERPSK
jgi:chemotaxis protein CheD